MARPLTRVLVFGGLAAAAVVLALVAALALGWLPGGQRSSRDTRLHCLPADVAVRDRHPGMVWVPGGTLALGGTLYPEERPVRTVPVEGFWMDRTEVTNAQFAAFVQATGYVTQAERPVDAAAHPELPPELRVPGAVVFTMPTDLRGGGDPRQWWRYVPGASWRHPGGPGTDLAGRDAFPVVAVTWDDARAYARWLGRELPTEAQWEWAARGGASGDPPPHEQPVRANTWQGFFPLVDEARDGFAGLAPVGCFEPNGYGLHDMIGNAWELTGDPWTDSHAGRNVSPDPAPGTSPGAPAGASTASSGGASPAAPGRRVIKGGSFLCAPNYCMRYRAGARQPQEDDLATAHVGFRTVLRAPSP
jgi:formylglycine-generating enzyme required for sulfatase activity